jgi:hypothetical protein
MNESGLICDRRGNPLWAFLTESQKSNQEAVDCPHASRDSAPAPVAREGVLRVCPSLNPSVVFSLVHDSYGPKSLSKVSNENPG